MRQLKRIRYRLFPILIFSLSIVITACSLIGVAYNNSDIFILRLIDKQIDLNQTQKDQLTALLNAARDYHRSNELPKYVAFLNHVKSVAAGGEITDEIEQLAGEFRQLLQGLLSQLIEAVAPAAAGLSEEQINSLASLFAGHWQKRSEQTGQSEPEQPVENKTKTLVSVYEYWLGDLTDEQQLLIQKTAEQLPNTEALQREYTERKQQEFIALLRTNPNAAQITAFLKSWLITNDDLSTEHRELALSENRLMTQLAAAMINSMDAKQKKRLNKRLDKWIKEFESLYPKEPKLAAGA